MFAPTSQKRFRILLFVVAALLLLFADLALAKKSGAKGKRSGSSPRTQKVAKASGRSKNRASNGGRTRSKAVHSPPSAISETKSKAPQRPGPSSRGKLVRQHNVGSLRSRQTEKAVSGRTRLLRPGTGPKASKHASNSPGRAKTSLKPARQQPKVKSGKRIEPKRTARIATPISKPKSPVITVAKVTRDRSPKAGTNKVVRTDKRKALGKSITVRKAPKKSVETKQSRKKIHLKTVDKTRTTSRTKEAARQGRETLEKTRPVNRKRNKAVNKTKTGSRSKKPAKTDRKLRSGRQRRNQRKGSTRYEDRRRAVKRTHRYEHVYRDRRGRISHRIVWPRYRFPVYYSWGPLWTFRYV